MVSNPPSELPDLLSIGLWTEPKLFTVDHDRLAAYADSTNDADPDRAAGLSANPVFAVLPAWETAFERLKSTLSPELLLRALHGEQDIRLVSPITPGMRLWTRAAVVNASPTTTGMTLSARAMSVCDKGLPVIDQLVTMFIRKVRLPKAVGPLVDRGRPPAGPMVPLRVSPARELDHDQTLRYARASGDGEAVHIDAEVAKSYGFTGVINHGNCTFAIAAQDVMSAVCTGDGSRVRRIAVRMSSPVLLDDTLTTTVYASDASSSTFRWETALSDGRLCLSDGFIEIGPA
ncbi:MaoC/PaaZ C-terminal domain-containing protein [Streptomyces sp. NPDC060209]|uniref:MaoC/PaaZ C-terminal domain-containing protein n=1 Tax=Streptomyces sp. NPDC060209 TaxID=3347073 RepID=UPI00365B7076